MQVLHFGRVVSGFVKRNVRNLAVWHRDIETVTEDFDVFIGELFGLVHIVFALATFAHAKTFDRFDQEHSRLASVFHSFSISSIDLFRIMTTAAQCPDFVIAHVRHHFQSTWVTTEEMFANVCAIIGFEGLVVAIQCFHHQLFQCAVFVSRQ